MFLPRESAAATAIFVATHTCELSDPLPVKCLNRRQGLVNADEAPVMQIISDGYGVKPSGAISLKFLDIFERYVFRRGNYPLQILEIPPRDPDRRRTFEVMRRTRVSF